MFTVFLVFFTQVDSVVPTTCGKHGCIARGVLKIIEVYAFLKMINILRSKYSIPN